MMELKIINSDPKGFTLVEIIVTIVAAGILGVIFVQFMGTALEASWNAVEIVRDESSGESVMEQIIADYVADINSDPGNALNNVVTNYNGQTINGVNITTQYIVFDASGNEGAGGSDNLKIVLQASGLVSPAISGRYPMTAILTNSRTTNDPIVLY